MAQGTLQPGETFAGFRVVRQIASGGMGIVYEVEQVSTGAHRALKVLTADALYEDAIRERFSVEALRTPVDDSEHVVQVLDAGVSGGIPWMLMELLSGETLTRWIEQRGPLPPREFLRVFQQLCAGVQAAHRRGIVHRDLKPDNVFIHRRRDLDQQPIVKVLDFGVAKALGREHPQATGSIVVGTPGWQSPEQTLGLAISPATDVWALGLIAFFCLTGRSFLGGDTAGASPSLVSASQRARELGCPERIPASFDGWLTQCLSMDARDRFRDAEEACAALLRAVGNVAEREPRQTPEPTVWAPPPVASAGGAVTAPMTPPNARRPWVIAALLAGTSLLALALAIHAASSRSNRAPTAVPPQTTEVPEVFAGCVEGERQIPGGVISTARGGQVRVRAFCIDRTEVTTEQYQRCVAARACTPVTAHESAGTLANVCNASLDGRGDHPINCLKGPQAKAFCAWREARLPTDAEWEMAARGTRMLDFPWGHALPTPQHANACGMECPVRERIALEYTETDPWPTTAPVGSPPAGASPFGVVDMVGNVSEWVTSDAPGEDGSPRWLRGSGWLDSPVRIAFAVRDRNPVTYVGRTIGVRCARSLGP